MVQVTKQWNLFLNKLKTKGFKKSSVKAITKAWDLALEKHNGQLRKSGEQYVTHLLSTAEYLLNWGMDDETIIAGLLHDILEDTDASFEMLQEEFTYDIAMIVYNVTKASKLSAQSRKEISSKISKWNDDYVINLLLSVSDDIRILTVKIADRLHNMTTINFLSPEKQERIARETFNIYASVAGRLGMYKIKTKLLDLSYMVLYKEEAILIKKKINDFVDRNMKNYNNFLEDLSKTLIQNNMTFELIKRIKGIYSTKEKLKEKRNIKNIHDFFAVRVIISGDELECYQALGIIHLKFKNTNDTFRDYISRPKWNLYQSLHTTIIHNGTLIEVQIRTKAMDQTANYGIAAHWKYKQNNDLVKNVFSDIIKQHEYGQESNSSIKDLTIGRLVDVTVLNNGLDYPVPDNWTMLDVAYRVNEEKIPYLIAPIVNEKKSTLSKTIQHNEKIYFEYNDHLTINKNWLNYCFSLETKKWIENFLKKIVGDLDEISRIFYQEISSKLEGNYVGNEVLKLRIIELGFNEANELLDYLQNNSDAITENDMINLGSNTAKKWKTSLTKIKNIRNERAIRDNLFFKIPNFIVYKRISYPSCCTKAPEIDCVGILEKKTLIIHNYSCSVLHKIEKQKYIIPWDKESVAKSSKLFNVIFKFIFDKEKSNDIIRYIANYGLPIKKIGIVKEETFLSKMKVQIGCSSIKGAENIIEDLKIKFKIINPKII